MKRRKLRPEEQATRAANLPRLREAAERAVAKGWFIFPAIYGEKMPFRNSNAQHDAKSGPAALIPWTENRHPNPRVPLSAWRNSTPANPCLHPAKSGLIVVDVDSGLKSVPEALTWARQHGWPDTYTVVSGRNEGDVGLHFYFRGVREVPDVNHPTDIFGDGVKWEIRHNCYVVVAGGLHKSGNWYQALDKDQLITPVPEFVRTYTPKKRVTVDERGKLNVAGTVTDGKLRLGDCNGKFVVEDWRHYYLMNRAGHLRREGGGKDGIFVMLKDIRAQLCENPSEITDETLSKMVAYVVPRPVDLKLDETGPWTMPRKRKTQQQRGPLFINNPEKGRYPIEADLATCLKGLYGILAMTAIKEYVKTAFPVPVNDRMIRRALDRAGWKPVPGSGRKGRLWQNPGADLADTSCAHI